MPPRRPISPLCLETCSPPTSDLDVSGVLGSDDELDEAERAAKHQRIERLAEAYLHGTPLFILSASLRGSFDKDWVNPWKKSRKATSAQPRGSRPDRKRVEAEEVVIQETNSRKRMRYHELKDICGSHSPIAPLNVDTTTHLQTGDLKPPSGKPARILPSHPTPRRSIPRARSSNVQTQEQEPSPFTQHDASWLKRDGFRINSRNIDPPTSPTTTICSRRSDRARATTHSYKRRSQTPVSRSQTHSIAASTDRSNSPAYFVSHQGSIARNNGSNGREPGRGNNHPIHNSAGQDAIPEAGNLNSSLYIVSSSSQLPQFEYRRRKLLIAGGRKQTKPPSPPENIKSPSIAEVEQVPNVEADPPNVPGPRNVSFADTIEHRRLESSQESHTLTKGSDTIVNPSDTDLNQSREAIRSDLGNTSEKLHSAQRVPGNPALMDCVTSLHTIAVSKDNSDYDGDTIPDPQFSTQAAVLLAQRSFQNDLQSPEQDPASAGRENNPSRTPGSNSSPASNIRPFCRLDTPHKMGTNGHPRPASAAGMPLMSTQCIIDAVTPFTFSTEKKKVNYRVHTSSRSRSSGKSNTSISFGSQSSPSIHSSPSPSCRGHSGHPKPDGGRDFQNVEHQISSPQDSQSQSQPSALPMTLTGTTPPTGQDGQGAIARVDSFSLSQAIADAGSWLQQSFEINRDLQRCANTTSGPPLPAEASCPTLSVDTGD